MWWSKNSFCLCQTEQAEKIEGPEGGQASVHGEKCVVAQANGQEAEQESCSTKVGDASLCCLL